MKVTQEQVVERRRQLDEIKVTLKGFFVGIDSIIDDLIDQIEAWWCVPEFLDRPAIVNLWGMTGVGKTDLIRRLVAELYMKSSFVEITMTSSSDRWNNTVESRLEEAQVTSEDHAILLVDEFQRFRTIDESGGEIMGENFADIWGLLSDGKFESSMAHKRRCEIFLFSLTSARVYDKSKEDTLAGWQIDDLRQIMGDYKMAPKIGVDDAIVMVQGRLEMLKENLHYSPQFRKLLIIISANLDEAFHDADSTDDATRDADSFHETSKEVTIFDIKKQLLKRFRPEQIARLGNNHIIYYTLSKRSFEILIQKHLAAIQQKVKTFWGFDLSYDNRLPALVYANGVFPAQGVRPVLSTITSIVENNIPYMISEAIRMNSMAFRLGFNDKKNVVKYVIADKTFTRKVALPVTDALKKIRDEMFIRICIHEAGHALLCALLFKMAPAVVNLRDVWGGGRVWFTQDGMDYESNLKFLIMLFGGREAERLILGEDLVSSGAENDLAQATAIAAKLVKFWGVDEDVTVGHIVNEKSAGHNFALDLDVTSNVNKLVKEAMVQARTFFSTERNHQLLIHTARFFQAHNVRLEGQELVDFWTNIGFTGITAQTFRTPWYGESIKEIWESAVRFVEK